MTTKNIGYSLVNAEGCLMDFVQTTSIANARKYFNSRYSGKYRIVWSYPEESSKNVILK